VTSAAVHAFGREAEMAVQELFRAALVTKQAGLRHRFEKEVRMARRMSAVTTGAAVAFGRRRMHELRFQQRFDLAVTARTKSLKRRFQKRIDARSVRLMTGYALPGRDRRMRGAAGRRRRRDVVAEAAEIPDRIDEKRGVLRAVRDVAGLALAFREGRMRRHGLRGVEQPDDRPVAGTAELRAGRLQEPAGSRMGIVTARAASLRHRRVDHRQVAARPDLDVASPAQVPLARGHQHHRLAGSVGIVAGQAVGGRRTMDDGVSGAGGILVAVEAEAPRWGA